MGAPSNGGDFRGGDGLGNVAADRAHPLDHDLWDASRGTESQAHANDFSAVLGADHLFLFQT